MTPTTCGCSTVDPDVVPATTCAVQMKSPDQQLAEQQATPIDRDRHYSSVIADKYASGQWMHSKGQYVPERYPTDREIVQEIQRHVAASVETFRNYRHVTWYTAFVAIYLVVLYFQVGLRRNMIY